MIYHDEGSSQWDTHDNVVRFGGGSQWLSLWTPTIHDDRIHDNFSDTAAYSNNGTDVDVEQATVVTDGNWPPAAQAVIAAAGPDRAPGAVADDDDLRVAYHGSWSFSGSRGLGDLDDGVHYTQSDGASATFSFTGTGASFVTETNGDEGPVGVTVDGTDKGTVDAATPERHTRQTLYSVTGLPPGPHTLTVTKRGGTYLLVDGFTVEGAGQPAADKGSGGSPQPGGSRPVGGSEQVAGYEEPGASRQAGGSEQVNASRQAAGYEQAGGSREAAGARTVAGATSRVSAWSPSMTIGGPNFDDRTLRMVVHPSVGGSSLRIHLSNLRSTTPLAVGEVRIALQAAQATARPGTEHQVTFGHKAAVTIPAGGELVSDPIPLTVAAEQNLLVSLYLPQATSSATWHSDAFDTTYLSAPGDHTADTGDGNYVASTTSWYYLSGLDVVPSTARGTVVAFGDSITDGYNTPAGAYHRWPDDLARRLAAAGTPKAVVDAGIGGNRVLTDVPNIWQGVSATKRFAHDALAQPGVKDVILLEGINDIGNNAGPGGAPLTVQDLTDGYRTLIAQAHAAGVRVIGATLLPDKGNVYYSEAAEAMRESVNTWIRTSGAFDGVVDFAAAAASPTDPTTLNPAFDSGDHLHPNESGMQALANAVDLSLLR
jgi:lysophospholipase L1-like esterase